VKLLAADRNNFQDYVIVKSFANIPKLPQLKSEIWHLPTYQVTTMAHLIPTEVVDSIIAFAIKSTDHNEAAQLSLVNKKATTIYKMTAEAAVQDLVREILKLKTNSTAFFKVSIRAIVKNKVLYELTITRKAASMTDFADHGYVMNNPTLLRSMLLKMVNTPNLRDIRTKLTFASLDQNTIVPAAMRFVQFMNTRCKRK
jgi:hypothetical protein